MNTPDNDTLLAVALTLAQAVGYTHVTREAIATHANVSPALISVRFGTMKELRRKLMRYAVRVKCRTVILQGIIAHDPHATKAYPDALKAVTASIA